MAAFLVVISGTSGCQLERRAIDMCGSGRELSVSACVELRAF